MKALVPTACSESMVRIDDVPEPTSSSDEALVAVHAFSVNRGETFQLERPRPGWRPGKDVAGTVVRAAADGTGPSEAARVVGHPPHSGWAQLVSVPTHSLAVLPEFLKFEAGAALPLAGFTALRLLRASRPLAGRRVIITGASGGVGHYLTELATAAGGEVYAISASRDRGERLRELGAVAVTRDVEDLNGEFDVAFESVGGDSLPRVLRRLRRGGELIWFGEASREPVTLDFFSYFEQTGMTIRHFHYEDSEVPNSRDLATLVRLVVADRLHPEVGLAADWSRTAEVLQDLRQRRVRGNAVLAIPQN